MFERAIVGHKEWALGFLTADDIRLLEDFDCEMRIRYLQRKDAQQMVKTYEQLVEQHGGKVPTQCEHGIPLYRKCGVCRALLG
jgi:hypothetical protein